MGCFISTAGSARTAATGGEEDDAAAEIDDVAFPTQ
jgi:hypothetical protein